MHFTHKFFILKQERYVFLFTNIWNSGAWGTNYKIRSQACFFQSGTPPPLCLSRWTRHSCDKMSQAFPLCFCILQVIKNWTVGRPATHMHLSVYAVQKDILLLRGEGREKWKPTIFGNWTLGFWHELLELYHWDVTPRQPPALTILTCCTSGTECFGHTDAYLGHEV